MNRENNHSSGIYTENLAVGYGGKSILSEINLYVENGKILTLIGPNGAGKTTILKSIIRELKPTDGCIYLAGKDMNSLKGDEIARTMSMVMTKRPKVELMTCREVVGTGRYPYTGLMGILSDNDWQKVDEAISLVGAGEVADCDFAHISDGQRQRVMLARAICQEPRVLVLDEPTSYLDIRFKLDILTTIRQLARRKKIAVIMSLHELELAKGISDYIACVQGNKLGKIGKPSDIFRDGYIQGLYGIEKERFDEATGMLILPEWEE